MSAIAKAVLSAVLVGLAMLGLHHGVQYSGWVLLVGLLVGSSI